MKISTLLFLLFINLLVISSCRMAESGLKTGVWWGSFLAIAVSLVFVAAKKKAGM